MSCIARMWLGTFLLAVVMLPACGWQEQRSSVKEFTQNTSVQKVKADVRLAKVEARADLGIRYQAFYDVIDWNIGRAPRQKHLNIIFPNLNASQFAWLKKTYGSDRSRVTFREGEVYTLDDFTLPFVQATLAKSFKTEWTPARGAFVETNCWGTSYEYLRLMNDPRQDFSAFFIDEWTATRWLVSHGEQVAKTHTLAELMNTGAIQRDDMILHMRTEFVDNVLRTYVNHTFIAIDHGVFFEKVARQDPTTYRFIDAANYYYAVQASDTFILKRFNPGTMQPPALAFPKVPIINVTMQHDANGRATLAPDAYRPRL